MTTTSPPAPEPMTLVSVHRAPTGWQADVRAITIVCHRELLRWAKDKGRIIAGLIQPLLWLFVLGTGLSQVVSAGSEGVNFRTFLYPGALSMSVLFTAVFSGVSVVWDREFGFLREMLVAPIRRSSIMIGKCLGGAIVATTQAVPLLVLAGFADVPYSPVLMVELLVMLLLVSFSVTAFGLLLAARIKNIQALMPLIQTVITPMMFLSGSLYPVAGLPSWLLVLTKINPLTYAVQPMRHVVFEHLDVPAGAAATLAPDVTWNAWPVPVGLQLVIMIGLGVIALSIAIFQFSRTD